MQTLSVSKLSCKSQATALRRGRERLRLKPGDSIAFKFRDGQIFLQKARAADHVFAKAVADTLSDEWHSANGERAYRDLDGLRGRLAVSFRGQRRDQAPARTRALCAELQ